MSSNPAPPASRDSDAALAADIDAIAHIDTVPALLRVICAFTGLGFAAVARVTDETWTACAVHDTIGFGLAVGDQLDVQTTLCRESRLSREPIAFDHASQDPRYCGHHTPRLYGLESYISVPIVRPNGDYFGNLCAVDRRPMRVSDERTLTMFRLYADLIALQLDNEERHRLTERALIDERAAAELRELFIATLGHDLRTPLAAISAGAEVLVRRPHEPEAARIGERLRATAKRMAGMIDHVLDVALSRLGGGVPLTTETVSDPAAMLQEVVSELRATHPGRVIHESIRLDRSLEIDRGRMQRVLSNLLVNALTHGDPEGAVEVQALMEGDAFVMRVKNGGTPIPQSDLARIFRPYSRASGSRPIGGLGLGLHICAEIVKAHGGTIDVESNAVDGTRFTVRVPARAADGG